MLVSSARRRGWRSCSAKTATNCTISARRYGGKLVFDYRLHTGPLTTRNAIRILEMYDYPRDLIAEAYEVQEKLTEKSN